MLAPAISYEGNEMAGKAKVYRWKQYSIKSDTSRGSKRMGTLAAIATLDRCTPILDTEKEVDESLLDADGFLAKAE